MANAGTIVACPNCHTKNRVRATSSGVPRCSVCQTLLPWIVEAPLARLQAWLDPHLATAAERPG